MNILFAGVGYFPFRVCGDKNYFFELLPLLARREHKIVVFSINDCEESFSQQECGAGSIAIYNVKRALHLNSKKYQLRTIGRAKFYHHKHPVYQEIPELFLTFLGQSRRLRSIVAENDIQIIHFMDNCGPAMRYLQAIFPNCKVCYSAMSYNKRHAIYDAYLRFSLSKLAHIIPYSRSLEQKYASIGIEKSAMTCIPWAVDSTSVGISDRQKEEIRTAHMIATGNFLFLWTGFIQQIGQKDLELTLDLAYKVVDSLDNVEFIFSFKPEFQAVCARYSSRHDRVHILDRVASFDGLLASCDYLLSPVANLDSIVAPPLTWIEAMRLGTPIITTAVGGSHEIIETGATGYIADDYSHLFDIISKIAMSGRDNQMRKRAMKYVADKYDIGKSAKGYLDLYKEIIENDN